MNESVYPWYRRTVVSTSPLSEHGDENFMKRPTCISDEVELLSVFYGYARLFSTERRAFHSNVTLSHEENQHIFMPFDDDLIHSSSLSISYVWKT